MSSTSTSDSLSSSSRSDSEIQSFPFNNVLPRPNQKTYGVMTQLVSDRLENELRIVHLSHYLRCRYARDLEGDGYRVRRENPVLVVGSNAYNEACRTNAAMMHFESRRVHYAIIYI